MDINETPVENIDEELEEAKNFLANTVTEPTETEPLKNI